MKISVIMPAYNTERYIESTIQSVITQDFDGFELLIGDDGSTDNTYPIAQTFSGNPHVRIFRNERNLGSAATRNKLVREAAGEFIVPCDSDDLLTPHCLKVLYDSMMLQPEFGVIYGRSEEIRYDENGGRLSGSRLIGRDVNHGWDLVENLVNHGGSIIRKSLFLACGGYDESVRAVDDWSLWLKLAEITRIKFLAEHTLYVWRRHPDSLTFRDKGAGKDSRRIVHEAAIRRMEINR